MGDLMRIAAAMATVLLLMGVTTACDNGPTPSPLPSVTTSAPPTSTTPSPPAMPTSATGRDTSAVKAFVRYWLSVFNYAANTGDTSTLIEISSPHCSSCKALIDGIAQTYAAGGHTFGDGWSATRLSVRDPAHITVRLLVADQEAQDSADAPIEHFKGGIRHAVLALDLTARGWLMLSIELT